MLTTYYQITCHNCQLQRLLSVVEMHQQLNALGMLVRQPDPEIELICELYRTTPETVACDGCGRTDVSITKKRDEFADLEPRRCENCNTVINPERLDVFPEVQTCRPCADNTTSADNQIDYCKVCGDLTSVIATRRRNITKYVARCNGCGHEN
ncbi:MAG: hypothetical protein CMJ76_01720 [Planctomycetaceae bacterium]|nr:hypothetical protein [Planctomycetaceae bacterium]